MSRVLAKGYVQIYTGDGKGKSTAAFGVAARMAGRGGRVFIGRFMKGLESGEILISETIPGIEYSDFGSGEYIIGAPSGDDIKSAESGLAAAEKALESGEYDLVIMDELCDAISFGLLSAESAAAAIAKRPKHTELILTGRGAPKKLIEIADLVTEMRPVKHYYEKGVIARKGIEY